MAELLEYPYTTTDGRKIFLKVKYPQRERCTFYDQNILSSTAGLFDPRFNWSKFSTLTGDDLYRAWGSLCTQTHVPYYSSVVRILDHPLFGRGSKLRDIVKAIVLDRARAAPSGGLLMSSPGVVLGMSPMGHLKALSSESAGVCSAPEVWQRLLNYTYKMDPDEFNFFRGKDTTQFGMELEVSTSLTCEELQAVVTDVEPKQEPFFIMKHDGSITGRFGNKVELVTVPCSPRYLRKAWTLFFQKLEKLAAAKGQKISDYFDCSTNLSNGIHIHINRTSFHSEDRRVTSGKPHVAKFIGALNSREPDTQQFFDKISCRPSGYNDSSYCYRSGHITGQRLGRELKSLREFSAPRYTPVNTTSQTYEVRIFQGIVDLKHVLRCISVTEALVDYTAEAPYSALRKFSASFLQWMSKQPKFTKLYKELV